MSCGPQVWSSLLNSEWYDRIPSWWLFQYLQTSSCSIAAQLLLFEGFSKCLAAISFPAISNQNFFESNHLEQEETTFALSFAQWPLKALFVDPHYLPLIQAKHGQLLFRSLATLVALPWIFSPCHSEWDPALHLQPDQCRIKCSFHCSGAELSLALME